VPVLAVTSTWPLFNLNTETPDVRKPVTILHNIRHAAILIVSIFFLFSQTESLQTFSLSLTVFFSRFCFPFDMTTHAKVINILLIIIYRGGPWRLGGSFFYIACRCLPTRGNLDTRYDSWQILKDFGKRITRSPSEPSKNVHKGMGERERVQRLLRRLSTAGF